MTSAAQRRRGRTVALVFALAAVPARADEPPRGRFDLGGTFDKYSLTPNNLHAGFQHFRDQEGGGFVEAGYRVSEALTAVGGYDVQHQLDFIDHRFNAGLYWTALSRLTLFLRGAVAPRAGVLPRWEALVEGELQVYDALALTGAVRHLEYPAQTINQAPVASDAVTVFIPGLRLNAGRRVAVILQGGVASHSSTPTTGFVSGRAEWAPLDRLTLSAGLSRGTESRRPFNPGLVSSTTTLTFGVRWELTDRLGARLDYAHEEFDREYTRNGLGSALTCRF